jgi:hypothetical protein
MTVGAVAFVPSAPLLIPEVAGGSAGQDAELRAASIDVVSRALGQGDVRSAVVVAATAAGGEWDGSTPSSFAGFGVGGVAHTVAGSTLPWQLGIAAWLLDQCEWSGPRRYIGLAGDAPIDLEKPTAVIAVGDGSACRVERAPGHLDPRAEAFDAAIADCLAQGDAKALAAIDEGLAEALLCDTVPVWRWLAAATEGRSVVDADLAMHVAPYGVGYFAALWSLG